MQQNFNSIGIYRNIISICLSLVSCNFGYEQLKSSDPNGESVLNKTICIKRAPKLREFTNIIEISNMSLSISTIINNPFLSIIYLLTNHQGDKKYESL